MPNKTFDAKVSFLGLFDSVIGVHHGKYEEQINDLLKDDILHRNIETCVHVLAANEDRSLFQPVLFSGVSDPATQRFEQIWMPGAHADVGGGYSDGFFCAVALITMIDGIRRHTKIGINNDTIEECQNEIGKGLKDDSKIIIHSESKSVMKRAIKKCLDWFNNGDRTIDQTKIERACQYASPIIKQLNGRKIFMQSKGKRIEFEQNKFLIQRLATMDTRFDRVG